MRFSNFVKQCEIIQARMDSIYKQVIVISDAALVSDLTEQQHNKLKSLYNSASQKHSDFELQVSKLFDSDSDDIDSSKVSAFQETISDYFINIQSTYNTLIKPDSTLPSTDFSTHSSSSVPVTPTIKLPQINLPNFSGNPEQWITFQGLFETAIHQNESITSIQKFTYLLSCLSNEPLSLIKSLPITSTNYDIAWQTLVKRYHNVRLLVTLHTNNIFDLPQLHKPNVKQLRDFLSVYNENQEALKALGYDLTKQDLLLSSLILRKFDHSFRSEFEHQRSDCKQIPTIQEVIQFIENECSQREAASLASTMTNPTQVSFSKPSPNFTKTSTESTLKPQSSTLKPHYATGTFTKASKHVMLSSTQHVLLNCKYCSSNAHNTYHCSEFLALTPKLRQSFIKGKGYCQNCFGTHKTTECRSRHSCRVCMKRHHTCLHFTSDTQPTDTTTVSDNPHLKHSDAQSNKNNATSSTYVSTVTPKNISTTVLLATALVNVVSSTGQNMVLRAVLDTASQTTIISEHCAKILKLKRFHVGVPDVTGISSAQVRPKGLAYVNLSSLSGISLAESHPVLILDKIANNLPKVQLSETVQMKLKCFTLADPTFDVPGPIDLLIGADLFAQTLLGPSISVGDNMPHAINTIFGYVVLGHAPIPQSNLQFSGLSTLLTLNELDLHATMQRFWSIEEPPHVTKTSPSDTECENHFLTTHSRDSTGRFVCRLPFKDNPERLGRSEHLAKQSFLSLEKRFVTHPEFKEKYSEFMTEYKTSGHMKLCESNELFSQPHCFLPHHGVFKDNKIRVVLNASALTSTGVTLNSILHQGPKLHNNIQDIILRFRQHKIVFACDVKQMFRMIKIHEDDQRFQLIYWRKNPSQPLQVYQLTTVCFGMSSSPFLANRVIQQLIHDEGNKYPLAAAALQKHIYVDDCLLGSDSVQEALELKQQVIDLLHSGGFELRKWISNNKDLLKNLPLDHCALPHVFKSTDQPFVSVLGLKWNPDSDSLSYVIEKPSITCTKRALLSTIAKIYDVTGILAPLIFWAKALMQHVWSLGLDWDTPLPDDIADRWLNFLNELPEVEKLKIPRYLSLADAVNIQLHGFSDASELGYAACVYLRTEDSSGNITVNLLIAKSRVAPLKRVTIPRLELCGANILAKLLHYCVEQLSSNYKIDSVTAWCDSTIALSWIQTPSYRLKLFIANRVSQIQELTPSCMWKHISSKDNPADCASRGLTAINLCNNNQWWYGPQWLKFTPALWPNSSYSLVPEEELPEVKPITLNLLTTTDTQLNFITKFSSWTKLLHVMCYVLRFIKSCKNLVKTTNALSLQELQEARNRICWLIQKTSFRSEIELLSKKKPLCNRIQRLAPFLDESGLLRVGGRLKHSSLPYDAKHQIILPKSHPVVDLIIDHYHKLHLHAGPQQLQAILQEHFWILSARSVIRSRIFHCLQCFKAKPRFNTPFMGELPESRVTRDRPFNTSGVDYAGPFMVKMHLLKRIQRVKMYLCLFICFVTKAVHLEVVTDLTSEAYTAALTRFISRRGLVRHLHSDCGTNFIGCASNIRTIFTDMLQDSKLQKFAEENQITFHFLPPHAPHQGGLWERAVKSAKYHLERVVGTQVLTYEEFTTLTARIEAMLNSRPLTPISPDPHEFEALTPGHFLTGGPLTSLIEPQVADIPINRLRRWQLVQAFSQQIWKRWQLEYLHNLQQRPKWFTPQENLKIGDLVVIHEPNLPPLAWKLGRISDVSPGADGIVRVVNVTTTAGIYCRPAVKVSKLPID